MSKLKLLELFGGIGACSKAFERIGINYEIVDYVEIDKYAVKSYNSIHGTNFEPQDITSWNKDIEVDMIMHGSPCQDFSLAGKQSGGDKNSGTRSSLMYETIRIVEKLKPKYVVWENVKNLLSKKHKHNFDAYLETMKQLGYTNYYQVLNAKDYGIPQNRERVFTISIRKDIDTGFVFPEKQPLKLKLKDMLEDKVDEKYYLSDKMINYISADNEKWTGNTDLKVIRKYGIFDTEKSTHQAGSVYDGNGLSPTLDTMQGGYRQPCIEIKNNTKQGYLEAHDCDGFYANVSTKRGTIQKDITQTLTTFQDKGVVVKDEQN
jgi:DNA (cytosine-5)-methyltransferase 1|nr:MAG TPA: Cytosine specific methyltransferase [Caudoviricetes sp.]